MLLVAGFSGLQVLHPDLDHAGQRRAGELFAPEQASWCTMRKPDRCHLSGITMKMILVVYKFDAHPTPETLREQQ